MKCCFSYNHSRMIVNKKKTIKLDRNECTNSLLRLNTIAVNGVLVF